MPLPQSLARFNRKYTNRLTGPVAGHLPGFGVVVHRGRRTGRTYRTPVNVFRRPGGFELALTYGAGDWSRNVLAAGGATLVTRGAEHAVTNPRLVHDPDRAGLPAPVRAILRRIGVEDFLLVDDRTDPAARP
jgi:deazaflavin-dependent oxidoreductase (nitroreductase family)